MGAPGDELRALLRTGLDQAVDPLQLAAVDQRAQVHPVAVRVPHRQLLGPRGEPLDVLVVQRGVDEMPAGRHADLALVEERAPRGLCDGGLDIGVLEYDEGRVPAQLQVYPLEMTAGQLPDEPPGGRGPGERHHPYQRVGDHRGPGLGAPRQHVQEPARQPGRGEDGGEREAAAHGGAPVRLEQHRVAEGEGRGDRADRQDQRSVERGHHTHHPGRDPAGEREPRRLARQHLTGRTGGQRGGLVALLGGDVQLEVGLAGYGTGLPYQPLPQLLGMGGEQVAGPAQDGGPLHVAGPRPVLLGGPGPYGGLRDIGGGGQLDGGEGKAGGGFDDRGGAAGQGRSVLPEGRFEERHGAGPPVGMGGAGGGSTRHRARPEAPHQFSYWAVGGPP